MVQIIAGVKGTGKTKKLLDLLNKSLAASNGNVVCLEKGTKLRFDVSHEARLINTNDYCIFDGQSLFGFVSGILASDHDVTDIFVDATLKICGDLGGFEKFVVELDELLAKNNCNVVMTISVDPAELSDNVRKFLID